MSNLLTERQRCSVGCQRTFRWASADGTRPGTGGEPGDVRRCEHGRIWTFVDVPGHIAIAHWRRVYRTEPITYRRAVRALREEPSRG